MRGHGVCGTQHSGHSLALSCNPAPCPSMCLALRAVSRSPLHSFPGHCPCIPGPGSRSLIFSPCFFFCPKVRLSQYLHSSERLGLKDPPGTIPITIRETRAKRQGSVKMLLSAWAGAHCTGCSCVSRAHGSCCHARSAARSHGPFIYWP